MLVRAGHGLQGLFFVHLALEKALKAHVTRATKDVAPKIHSLGRLAQMSAVALSEEQLCLLDMLDRYCVAGRYPDEADEELTCGETVARLTRGKELYQWLMGRL